MGSRPAKATGDNAKDSGPNGSEGDVQASTSGREGADQQQQQQQQLDEALRLRAAVERMESQIAALKEELNKEIELNSELRTETNRQQQTTYLAIGTAIAAAIAAALLYRRR